MNFKEMLMADLEIFLNSDEFAVTVACGGKTINCLFSDASEVAHLVGIGVATSVPQILVKSSDVVGVKRKDPIVVNATTYYVCEDPQHDGTGCFTTLKLSEDIPE